PGPVRPETRRLPCVQFTDPGLVKVPVCGHSTMLEPVASPERNALRADLYFGIDGPSPGRPAWKESAVEQTNGFWAGAIALAPAPVARAAGMAKGSYDAGSGSGSFDAGFHSAADPVIVKARKFGEDHQETITRGVIGGAATAVGARIVGESLKVILRR